MIIGPLTLSDNMSFVGDVESSQVIYEPQRTIEGLSKVTITEKIGGRIFTIGSDLSDGSTMGIWCQSDIEDVKALELSRAPQTIIANGKTYSAYIVETTNFTPMFKQEPSGPTKKYTGTIKLIEA